MDTIKQNVFSIKEMMEKTTSMFRYIFSKWYLICLVAFLSGCIGVAFAWFSQAEYTAEMTFITEAESSSKVGGYAGIAAQFGIDVGEGGSNIFSGDNLNEIMKSHSLLEKTLLNPLKVGDSSFLLIDCYLEKHKIKQKLITNPAFKNFHFSTSLVKADRLRDSLMKVVIKEIKKKQLFISRLDKKLGIVTIKMTDSDELFAKRFTEVLAGEAIEYYTNYKAKKSKQNVNILQHQADSIRGVLFGSISNVAELADLNVNPIRQSARTGVQRKQVDVQVAGVLYTEILKNLELSKLALRKETPLIQVIDTPILPLEKKKPGRLFTGILFSIAGAFFMVLYLFCFKIYKRIVNS